MLIFWVTPDIKFLHWLQLFRETSRARPEPNEGGRTGTQDGTKTDQGEGDTNIALSPHCRKLSTQLIASTLPVVFVAIKGFSIRLPRLFFNDLHFIFSTYFREVNLGAFLSIPWILLKQRLSQLFNHSYSMS